MLANIQIKKTKLWSFEVKMLVNRSNIREVFFQTVSNSSWSNFGYLVASEIEGTDTLKELRILSSLHGIGIYSIRYRKPFRKPYHHSCKRKIRHRLEYR